MKKVFLTALALGMVMSILSATGCSSGGADLEGKRWVLESYGDRGSPTIIIEDSTVSAEFTEGQINGSAGCNNYFGSYEVSGKNLTFGPVASTEMYCMDPEGIMDQEYAYLKSLGQAETYEISGGKLLITCTGDQLLTFEEE